MVNKVLVLSKSSPTQGGVESWLDDLIGGLLSIGYECRLGLAKGFRFHDPDGYLAAHPVLSRIPVDFVDGVSGIPEGRRHALATLIRREKPDIIIPVMLHETLGAASERRRAGQVFRIIYPVHEDGVWAFRAVEEYQDQIDAVVTVNRLMLEAFNHYLSFPLQRLFHIRGGVSPPRVVVGNTPLVPPLRLGYCGKLVEDQKRISDLALFCEELDRIDCDFMMDIAGAGSGSKMLESRLKGQIESGRVRLLDLLSREQIYREFYPNLDALVITSDWETGPLVAWEAMMHGVLVVASAYRGLSSEKVLIHLNNALVFPVGQPEQGARLLAELVRDPDRLKVIAEAGRRTALDLLTVDQMVAQWDSVLTQVTKLPVRESRNRDHYGPVRSLERFRGWIDHTWRKTLHHPFYHGRINAEWPFYKIDYSYSQEQLKWIEQLIILENMFE